MEFQSFPPSTMPTAFGPMRIRLARLAAGLDLDSDTLELTLHMRAQPCAPQDQGFHSRANHDEASQQSILTNAAILVK